MSTQSPPAITTTLEENLKKALTELLILHLLNIREYFIGEITDTLTDYSNGILNLVFPYSAVYRLQNEGYIADGEKRIASDGRRRQFYRITQQGREYYRQLMDSYRYFIGGINTVLNAEP
jgi:PadR family transcriptional regulator PadR